MEEDAGHAITTSLRRALEAKNFNALPAPQAPTPPSIQGTRGDGGVPAKAAAVQALVRVAKD